MANHMIRGELTFWRDWHEVCVVKSLPVFVEAGELIASFA